MSNEVKVLIVDDDKASANLLAEVVKRMGFSSVIAHKPADALNIVRLQTVHAAIVDVLLPKMSGIDLAMEFKQTKFADAPVILVSGIFKDKAFAAEALKKTSAGAFIFKPFSVDEIMGALNKALEGHLSATKWTVQSMLTRQFKSGRERAKAVENLEEIHGSDFPFILSTLLDPEVSGNLNIINSEGDIFGVTINQGTVSKVDSAESQMTAVETLIESGFLSQADWDEAKSSIESNEVLSQLVIRGYVSPHAVYDARGAQMMQGFREICRAKDLKVNFALIESEAAPVPHALDRKKLLALMSRSFDEIFKIEEMIEFYSPVKAAPLQLMVTPDELEEVWTTLNLERMEQFQAVVESSEAFDHLLTDDPEHNMKIYSALHFLVMSHMVTFTDTVRAKNLVNMLTLYKKLYADLHVMSPDKIFEFFGANPQASPEVIGKVYEEYVLSNHPGQIPKEASPELKDLCRKCFDLVTEAKDILSDDDKRKKLFDQLKVQAIERQGTAAKTVNVGMDLLRKGQAQLALSKLKEAEALHSSPRGIMISFWAEIKAGATGGKPRLIEMVSKLEMLPIEEKRTALYYMVLGLAKRGMGDVTAQSFFEKALQVDPQFVEARRELNSSLAAQPASKKLDLFNGDITQIVSQIFRRKAD